MNKSLVSVIIPVFRVEDYLNRCVESIVNQTYDNLEIILVDDGSDDNCPHMCDEWAKKDDRIVVYHKQNGGLSDARNFGTDKANGELITYIDSDDYILPEYVEHLYNSLVEHNADISCCNFEYVYSAEREIGFNKNEELTGINKTSGKNACYDLLTSKNGFVYKSKKSKLYNLY